MALAPLVKRAISRIMATRFWHIRSSEPRVRFPRLSGRRGRHRALLGTTAAWVAATHRARDEQANWGRCRRRNLCYLDRPETKEDLT